MNDLDLLDAHGPSAHPLHDHVLLRARTSLLDEIERSGSGAPAEPPSPRTWGRPWLVVGLVAACAAAAAIVTPSLLQVDGAGAVALGDADPLTFPLTPTDVPSGLGRPVVEVDEGFVRARYGSARDGLTVTTDVDSDEFWDVPDDATSVDVAGRDGRTYSGTALDATTIVVPTVSVVWEGQDGDWTRVSGSGLYADAARVESFAESLRSVPQPVRLALAVAPEGWTVDAYKDDRVVRLAPEAGTVARADGQPRRRPGRGPRDRLRGQGRDDGPRCTAPTPGWGAAPTDGSWSRHAAGQRFSVQAPDRFTREQVVEVADGVTYTPCTPARGRRSGAPRDGGAPLLTSRRSPRERLEGSTTSFEVRRAPVWRYSMARSGRLVGPDVRPRDAVLDHPAEVVVLMGVDERVVHAHVGVTSDEDQGLGAQALEQDLQLGAEEARVATLADHVVVGTHTEIRGDLRPGVALEEVDSLGAVELATEVDEVPSVCLLEEDDRDAALPRLLDEGRHAVHGVLVAGHERDGGLPCVRRPASLDVDDHEDRTALDQITCCGSWCLQGEVGWASLRAGTDALSRATMPPTATNDHVASRTRKPHWDSASARTARTPAPTVLSQRLG